VCVCECVCVCVCGGVCMLWLKTNNVKFGMQIL